MENHEDNINNLNRLTEENIKTIFKQGETLEKIRNTNEILLDKADKHDKLLLKISNELLRFNEVEKNLRENRDKIDETNKNLSDYQYYSNKKFADLDTSILNMIDTLNELNRQMEKKGTGNVNISHLMATSQSNQESSNQQLITEIGKSNKEIENLKKLFRDYNEKVDKMSKSNTILEEQIKEIKSDKNFIGKNSSNNISSLNSNKKDGLELGNDKNLLDDGLSNNDLQMETDSLRQNIEMIFDRMKKFQDYFKSVTTNLGQKTEKSEFEKLSRLVNQEMEKVNKKINELNTNTEQKIKSFILNGGVNLSDLKNDTSDDENQANNNSKRKTSINNKKGNSLKQKSGSNNLNTNLSNGQGFEFDEGIINMTKEIIEKELQGREELIKMQEFMEEYREKSQNSQGEIDKIFESIVEIRSYLTAIDSAEEKIGDLKDKIYDLDFMQKKHKALFEERLKNLEGDPIPEDGNPNPENNAAGGGSIKDNIKNLNNYIKVITEKIDKVSLRQDNMNSEILTRVKKDLSTESGKILNDFKGDLKLSITKIEDQLTEKVDKFSLEEFGKYVNNKLSQEMNKKLDRNDLKKNNNLINKKIDTLETKISKTLVDTLIDLQMEEAPLLVKKSMGGGGEKCASCNQVVLNSSIINEEINENPNNKNISMTVLPQKFKFKNVQESFYKFGAGSYSRYLSCIDNNFIDDLKSNKNVHLPEINSNRTSRKFNNIIGSEIKTKNKYLEEFTEKNYNSMINEELEKKVINPENLIKTANKLFESVESQKKSLNIQNNFNNK